MIPNPTIAFCTTCKGRLQHLEKTLPKNFVDNKDYPNAKFVILDYNSQDGLADYININYSSEMRDGKIVLYRFLEPGPFRMAHAKNVAHRLGILEGGDILVNLDADNYTGSGFASYIANKFQMNDIFLLARRRSPAPGGDLLAKGINGRTVVTKWAFINSGGYDEKFNQWGPDDKDFSMRLQRMGYIPVEIERKFLNAVLHNDRMRFREYPQAQASKEDDEILDNTKTIANFGNLGQGIVFRNFNFYNPIFLTSIPTRIFGIGMHKTATTSLHTALRILGYDSAHWKSAHWAKAIWEEMLTLGKSATLEKSYALCDLPITTLYKLLDLAYPRSKFILTTRNSDTWIRSVKDHWDSNINPFRKAWDTDPFTHKIHKEIYGRRDFDAEGFLARFQKHNSEVQEYFANRPDDLLTLNLSDNYGWTELCKFLNQPIPKVPYPKQLVTEKEIIQ